MEHIKQALDVFLGNSDPGVLAIKGDWGVGKTYFVQHYLEAKQDLEQQKVSYVSLFGLSSAQEVRRQIVPSAISRERLRKKEGNERLKSLIGMARKLPKVADFEAFFQTVEEFAMRDLLVIFDDLERKSDNLPLKDFLGFVNFLSEHSNSKAILILNEDQLTDPDKEGLAMFREKLIDKELLFAPTYEQNARIFFHDSELFDTAVSVFERCDCRNLRVIKRCFGATQEFRARIQGASDARRNKLLRQLVLLSCAFYRYGGRIDFSSLTNYRLLTMLQAKDGSAVRGADILKKIGFTPSDDDSLILDYLDTGTIDDAALEQLKADDAKFGEFSKISDELRVIYRIFNANFGGTAAEFRQRMNDFLGRNATKLGWNDLGQAATALREFGYPDDANKWLAEFVRQHAPSFSLGQCDTFGALSLSNDAQNAVAKRKAELLTKRPLKDVIRKIGSERGWSGEDTAILNNAEAITYADWLVSAQDEDLLQVLRVVAETFNPASENPEWKSIGNKLFEALAIVAGNDPFRLKKITDVVGIDAENLFQPTSTSPPKPTADNE